MYYICKRDEWGPPPVGLKRVLLKALESLQGQRVDEDQLRFALDVHAQEFEEGSWAYFKNNLPELLTARRITMDKNEIRKLRMQVVGQIKEVMQPLREVVKSEVMAVLADVSQRWDMEGLEWGVSQIAERRMVANILRLAQSDKVCGCGHHERAHVVDRSDASGLRPCRQCRDRSCEDFHAAGR